MSKIKNGGLDQYGAEPLEQQQFGTAGIKGVNCMMSSFVTGRLQYIAVGSQRSSSTAQRLYLGFLKAPSSDVGRMLFRPPDIYVGGLIFYQGLFLLSFFFLSFLVL